MEMLQYVLYFVWIITIMFWKLSKDQVFQSLFSSLKLTASSCIMTWSSSIKRITLKGSFLFFLSKWCINSWWWKTDAVIAVFICIILDSSWSRVLNHITTVDDIPVTVLQSGKLRDRDRNIIKEKFAVSICIFCKLSVYICFFLCSQWILFSILYLIIYVVLGIQ